MSKVETKRVKFKEGKFKGEVMTINASDFNPALHESAGAAKPAPKGKPAKGK